MGLTKCTFCKRNYTVNQGNTDQVKFYPKVVAISKGRLHIKKMCLRCFYDLLSQNLALVNLLLENREIVVKVDPMARVAPIDELRLDSIKWPKDNPYK